MHVSAHAGSGWSARKRPSLVQCGVCACRFFAAGAAIGDRVACSMCSAEVVIEDVVVERRRAVPSSVAPPRSARRLTKDQLRLAIIRCVEVLVVAALVGAAVHWRAEIEDALRDTARTIVETTRTIRRR